MSNNRLDFKDFEPKLGEWANKFKPFIESEDMYNIYQKIKSDAFYEKDGKFYRKEFIVPDNEDTFNTFKITNPSRVKVIFYLMDPYPRKYKENKKYQATGVAMDCSNTPDGKIQPSLIKFYDSVSTDLGKKVEYSPSLNYLLEQGVMMLNTDLTCKLNKTGSHEKLWEPFQKYFLQEIMGGYTGVIYILCGKDSKRMRKYIYEMGNYVFELEHPAAAEHMKRAWNYEEIFNKINNILKTNNGMTIFWDKKDWDEELPF
jgi:uracil DNA glycosylase